MKIMNHSNLYKFTNGFNLFNKIKSKSHHTSQVKSMKEVITILQNKKTIELE